MSKQATGSADSSSEAPTAAAKTVAIPEAITVRELGELVQASPIEVIKELMKNGVMAAVNQAVPYEVAAKVAEHFDLEPQRESQVGTAAEKRQKEEGGLNLRPRPPVVTVMGHVDHGKTSLLDAIREANVTQQEVGSITQHIGAYQVEVNGQRITFIDTPGHEAFTAMRARGAMVTDIVVLVVAADDGIMPQTVEAIDHARAADVPIIVAINKIDLPDANPERVKQQLAERELLIEEWGGDIIAIPVSAKTKEGIDNLLEHILLVAEISELKGDPDQPAGGTIIEAEMDPTRGPVATVLVQKGTLKVGDVVTAGDTWGRVKAMFNERGQRVQAAGPSTPVKMLGLAAVPQAGDLLIAQPDERTARQVLESSLRERGMAGQTRAISLEAISGDIAAGKVKELNLVVKADVQGSVEAIQSALQRLSNEATRVKVRHHGTGSITESDLMLALASKGIVIGFHVGMEPGARRLSENEGVDVRLYDIIYHLTEDVEKALTGLLEPVSVEVVDGHAEVRAVFAVRGGKVAGCYVTDGVVRRNSKIRVQRGGQVVHTAQVASLRRFKEAVREVQNGFECGIGLEGFSEFEEGDILEAFHTEQKG